MRGLLAGGRPGSGVVQSGLHHADAGAFHRGDGAATTAGEEGKRHGQSGAVGGMGVTGGGSLCRHLVNGLRR